jgi:hypothetical protein
VFFRFYPSRGVEVPSITHKQSIGWPEQAIKAFHGLSKDSKVMKYYSHLSYSNLEQIQRKMNNLPADNVMEINKGIKCANCGQNNPLYLDVCECGLPIELQVIKNGHVSVESEIEARMEQRIQEFIDRRLNYDVLMDRFMNCLVEKTKTSPELRKAIREIGSEIKNKEFVSSYS